MILSIVLYLYIYICVYVKLGLSH